MATLGRMLRVLPGEGRTVGLLVLLMCIGSFGLAVGESGVSALFLDRVGADALPAMYMAQGALGFVAMLILTGTLGRISPRRAYLLLPVSMAAIIVASRLILSAGPTWIYPAAWIVVTLAYLFQAVYVWGTAGLVTDTRTAKRLFPLFGSGNILGAVIGGLVTPPLAQLVGAANLLWIWAVSLFAVAGLCALALGRRAPTVRRRHVRRRGPSAMGELVQGLRYVRRSSLLTWMTAASVLFSVLFYSLYLPFAHAATERFADPDELAGFLGLFWGSVTAVAFLVSILVANRLLGRFGAAALIVVLPVLYMGAFGILLGTSALAVLVAIRFTVNVWLQGVASPGWETLINVVPASRRDQTRAFMNGGPAQAGTAIAGLVQIFGQQALSARQLAGIGIATAAVTAFVALRIRRAYTGALVEALRAGRPPVLEAAPVPTPVLVGRDGDTLRIATQAATDPDPMVRRLAMHMLGGAVGDTARAAATAATEDEDAGVRAAALAVLADDPHPDDGPAFEASLADADPDVRLAAVRGLGALGRSAAPAIDDPDPSVAATAAALAVRYDAGVLPRLREMLSSPDPEVRLAALAASPLAGEAAPRDLVRPLTGDLSPLVRAAALGSLAHLRDPDAAGAALDRLRRDPDPSVRRAAIDVLANEDVEFVERELRDVLATETAPAVETFEVAASVPADGDASALLRDALMERARGHAVVALSVGALLSRDPDAVRVAVDNIDAKDPGQLANAIETLDVTIGSGIGRSLLRIWEATTPDRSDGTWLDRAAAHGDPFIRECAELVRRSRNEGAEMARGDRATMTRIELVLQLRKVPLLAALAPSDLDRVSRIAEERAFADGEAIGIQGEVGEELHIVVSGTVRVLAERDDGAVEIARRGSGDVVGEMSIITREPRVASLVADGDVRTVRLGQREFESMLRERPDLALAVMRVLADRLRDASLEHANGVAGRS